MNLLLTQTNKNVRKRNIQIKFFLKSFIYSQMKTKLSMSLIVVDFFLFQRHNIKFVKEILQFFQKYI